MYKVEADFLKSVIKFYVDDNEVGSISFDELRKVSGDDVNLFDNFYYVKSVGFFYYLKDNVKYPVVLFNFNYFTSRLISRG